MPPLKPVPDSAYPFWPYGSPQAPAEILRYVQRAIVQELPLNQIPGGNGAEIPIRQLIKPKTQPIMGPSMETNSEKGKFGSNLYDAFMAPYNAGG